MRKEMILASMIALSGCVQLRPSAGLVRIEDLDRPLKAVAQPPMEYSEVWQRPRINSEALVALTIQEDGSVADVALVKATNPEIGLAAVASVKKWRFEPPTSRGAPAKVQMKVPIVSELENTKFVPMSQRPNKAPEPTPTSVTSPAHAGAAPAAVVAHL